MTPEEQKKLAEDIGKQAADEFKKEVGSIEDAVNKAATKFRAGLITEEAFAKIKTDSEEKLNAILKSIDEQKETSRIQGEKINAILKGANGQKPKSMYEFLELQMPKLKALRAAGTGAIEVSLDEIKAAGVTSIGGSILPMTSPPTSPYAPGIDGTGLEIYDQIYNPNFIINRVSLGTASSNRIAYIDEQPMEGAVGVPVAESGTKPLVQHKFKVSLSEAVKAAAFMTVTEEFQDDVPELYAQLKNMLQADVLRAQDTELQAFTIANARPFNDTGLYSRVQAANYYDALYALYTQVGHNNFDPNTTAVNWNTNFLVRTEKNVNDSYLTPPFWTDDILRTYIKANKLDDRYALVGDLRQIQVRIYKALTLRMGWINTQFQTNEFSIVAEIRYHRFISENRKNGIAYGYLPTIKNMINGNPTS